MQNSITSDNRIIPISFFKSQEEMVFFLLLNEIQKNEPLGSWTLNEILSKQSIQLSTATIGRYLKMLDGNGYTVRKSNLGRVMTDEGREWLRTITERLARAEVHDEASAGLRVHKYADLLDLIQARKAIEIAIVRLAAVNANQSELSTLQRSVALYYRDVAEKHNHDESAYNFHTIIAEMSHNKYFKNLLDILIFEEKQIEEHMDKLVTKDRGNIYVVQHDDIAAALEAHDPELAEMRMSTHIDAMYNDIKQQIAQIQAMGADTRPGPLT